MAQNKKNTLLQLNEHLFTQLGRLNDELTSSKDLPIEIERSKAVSMLAKEIIANARLAFDAHKLTEASSDNEETQQLLGIKK